MTSKGHGASHFKRPGRKGSAGLQQPKGLYLAFSLLCQYETGVHKLSLLGLAI